MKYYLAPLEGITTFVYRNAFDKIFNGSADKFFAPFIMPHIKRDMNFKEKKELMPENNKGINLVPQILTDSADDFLRYQKILKDMGYDEININLGCPSGTVTAKGRGAGFLSRKEELDRFFESIFEQSTGSVSVKTRIGIEDPCEFYELLEIYNKYPIKELIVHPRVLKEQYKGLPHRDIFGYTMNNSKNPVVYSGDIWSAEDFKELNEYVNKQCADKDYDIMIGRGAIADPSVFRQLKGGKKVTSEELSEFMNMIEDGYRKILTGGDIQILFRLKEIWTWLIRLFPDSDRTLKKMLKCKNIKDFKIMQKEMISKL